ncbi:unnamed protein product [Symbiodinium sp. CCMP2456]|nr:unnamed protein product [Symbiodinium sp. CCMP2456]
MGGTPYKGQWRPLAWFSPRYVVPQQVGCRRAPGTTSEGWRVLCWNSGGLTKEVYQELETYVRLGMYHIVLIQETKWRHTSMWSGRDYVCVHSQGQSKADSVSGLLTMVSTSIVTASDLQYLEIHPGRLLHIRIPRGQSHVDIVNLYQYAATDSEGVYERRMGLLTKLQKCVAGLPRRNSVVLGGDFNCPLEPHPPQCGHCVLPHNPTRYKDYRDHQNVVQTLNLVALNTWCKPQHGQLATFTFGRLASQIDYLMVRSRQASAEARRAQIIDQFPVAAWREGANHHPVEARIPVPRLVPTSQPQPPLVVRFDQDALLHDVQQVEATPSLQAMRDEVSRTVQGVDNVNVALLQAANKYYPLPPQPQRQPDQPEELANSAKHMWALHRAMKAQQRTAKGIVTAWHMWARFQQAHRIHKQRSRQRTKVKRDSLLEQAQQAALAGNTFGLWRVVRQLAPKMPRKRVQLHREGRILSTQEELDWILQAYGERYGANLVSPTFSCTGESSQQHVTIQEADLVHQLQTLNPRKAVPRGTAPSVLWKACCRQVVPSVVAAINRQWRRESPEIPQHWADATVALLPKPHGRSRSPLDWRPIGLQDPLGKSVMALVLKQARNEIIRLIRRFPQTAYVPGRSTTTALCQVFQHCSEIRELSRGERLTVHQRYEGETQQPCCGGLQISMDLSAAFDLARWEHIKTALDLAGTPLHLQEVLLRWLTQVKYIFHHRDCSGKIHPKWGLRQGCTASPILWSAFTALLCVTLEDRLGEHWTRQHATLYADDSHLRWKFLSYPQFERTMQEVKIAFSVFRSFHMKLNVEKTKAIIKVVGTMRSKIHKEHIRKIRSADNEEDGLDKQRLLLSPRDPTNWLPLVTQTEYLGLVISYGPFELQSLRHRVAKANNRRWAMASILHSRKLGVAYKLRFWRSCVLSILTYGLHCCGLTGDNVQEAQRAMMRHVRAVVLNQAHLTGDTHEYIRTKYGIPCFADLLRGAQERDRQAAAQQHDWMWSEDWSQHIRDRLEQVLEPTHPEGEQEVWSCPKCEATFGTAAALKTHARRTHDIHEEHPIVFNKAEHALGGLPTCSKCHKKFSKWQTLAQHINRNSCPSMIVQPKPVEETDAFMNMPVLHSSEDTARLICQRTEVVRASSQGINAFIPLSDVRMLADPDLNEFFGEVSQEQSLKRRRPTEDNKGQGKGQATKYKAGKNDELVTTLARLALRQEEELQVLKQDHSFMMFMKPGRDSILHYLYQTATLFKKKQAESPTWGVGFQPARQVLALALFRELASRLETMEKDQARIKEVVDMGWATSELTWKFQAWNPQLRILQEDKDRKPLTTVEVKHSLERLYAAVKTGVVTRFSCTRKLTETMENQASFYFDLSSRGAGIEAWEHMEKLEGCCVLQLVGLAYKRAGLRRGPLAQKLRELLGQR